MAQVPRSLCVWLALIALSHQDLVKGETLQTLYARGKAWSNRLAGKIRLPSSWRKVAASAPDGNHKQFELDFRQPGTLESMCATQARDTLGRRL
jgi:hypothetical protein